MNAGGVLNTCKSSEALTFDFFGMKELTAPGADISPNHEGCGAFPPTFPHIGATAAATDGM